MGFRAVHRRRRVPRAGMAGASDVFSRPRQISGVYLPPNSRILSHVLLFEDFSNVRTVGFDVPRRVILPVSIDGTPIG